MTMVVTTENKEQEILDLDKLNSKVLKKLANTLETISVE